MFMMSTKWLTQVLRVFWKKGYDIIISVNSISNKILSRDSNYNVNVVM